MHVHGLVSEFLKLFQQNLQKPLFTKFRPLKFQHYTQ